NVFITVTKVRYIIIKAIPVSLQHAICGGIGVFVAYLGFKKSNLITFLTSGSDIITVNCVAPADATAETFSNGGFSVFA
ncbi:NCS2 family permease, partial [Streptococcus suis]